MDKALKEKRLDRSKLLDRVLLLITTCLSYAVLTTRKVSTTYFPFTVNDLQEYHIVVSNKLKSYKYDNR